MKKSVSITVGWFSVPLSELNPRYHQEPKERLSDELTICIFSVGKISNPMLQSYTIAIDDLDIAITDNKNILIVMEEIVYFDSRYADADPSYHSVIKIPVYAYTLRDLISPKLTMGQLYRKFKKVKTASVTVGISFVSDDILETMSYTWNYIITRNQSNALLDIVKGGVT
jgi:hypothetical protein